MDKMKKIIIIGALFFGSQPMFARPVDWRFHIGGMPSILNYRPDNHPASRKFTAMLGAEIQLPLAANLYLESGLDFRYAPATYTYWCYDSPGWTADFIPLRDFDGSGRYIGTNPPIDGLAAEVFAQNTNVYLDIPVRFGYRWNIGARHQLQLGFGPYLGLGLAPAKGRDGNKLYGSNCVSVGITPSVVYRHRAFSVGLHYQNPCLYNGTKNRETHTLMLSLGINVRGRKLSVDWDSVVAGLEAASGVLNATTETMMQSYGDEVDSGETAVSSGSKTSDFSIQKRTARNNDYKAYFQCESMVIKILNGDDKVNRLSDVQKKMKRLREKWDARNDGWGPSRWETAKSL